VAEGLHQGRISLGDGTGAFDDDGLEELGAHDRSDARPAARPSLHAPHDGVAVQVLAALADVQDADALAPFAVDPIVGGVGPFPPQVVSGEELDLVVFDIKERRLVGLAFDDQGVVSRFAELVGDPRSEVSVTVESGEGRLGRHDGLAGVRRRDAGDWAEGDDELVLRPEGVDSRLELIIEDLDGEAAPSDPFMGEFLAEGLFFVRFRAEIDSEEITCPTNHDDTSWELRMTCL